MYTCTLSLALKFRVNKIVIAIFILGYKILALYTMGFYISFRRNRGALTRVFLERRDLITIDELVIFFDPSILLPASILSRGYFLSCS